MIDAIDLWRDENAVFEAPPCMIGIRSHACARTNVIPGRNVGPSVCRRNTGGKNGKDLVVLLLVAPGGFPPVSSRKISKQSSRIFASICLFFFAPSNAQRAQTNVHCWLVCESAKWNRNEQSKGRKKVMKTSSKSFFIRRKTPGNRNSLSEMFLASISIPKVFGSLSVGCGRLRIVCARLCSSALDFQ